MHIISILYTQIMLKIRFGNLMMYSRRIHDVFLFFSFIKNLIIFFAVWIIIFLNDCTSFRCRESHTLKREFRADISDIWRQKLFKQIHFA